jgi:polar amino acid transport system substrate-binding protein
MRTLSACCFLVYMAMLSPFQSTYALSSEPLHICVEDAPAPPYTYGSTHNLYSSTSTRHGAGIDFLLAVSKKMDLPIIIHYAPWKRCLLEVDSFPEKGSTYEGLFSATINTERLNTFYVSAPTYRTAYGIFYVKERFPDPDRITIDLINQYTVCGILGHNYEHFERNTRFTHPIEQSAHNVTEALQRLLTNRCDFFVTCLTTADSFEALNPQGIPDTIGYHTLTMVQGPTYHILLTKKSPRSQEIISRMNNAIFELQFNGVSEKIFRSYLPAIGNGLS